MAARVRKVSEMGLKLKFPPLSFWDGPVWVVVRPSDENSTSMPSCRRMDA